MTETQLLNIAGGDPAYVQAITDLLNNSFDDRNINSPNAYLVWMLYDVNMKLIPQSSGAIQVQWMSNEAMSSYSHEPRTCFGVQNPNALETLIQDVINVSDDGYLHVPWMLGEGTSPYSHESRTCFGAYVSNGSSIGTHFDNFLVTHQRGKVRQMLEVQGEGTNPSNTSSRESCGVNDYYPYGLAISGINGDYDDYLDKYTSKELQIQWMLGEGTSPYSHQSQTRFGTGEFDVATSTGMEMFDFGSRYYDPQLGRWFTPDPAEQFKNPYLGIGNNPVMYVGPDGEFVWYIPLIYAAVNVAIDLAANDGKMNFGQIATSAAMGAIGGILGGATTAGTAFVSAYFSQVSKFLPGATLYESDNFSLTLSPMIGAGTSGINYGASLNASGQSGDFVWSASVSGGHNSGMTSLGEAAGPSNYIGGSGFAGYNDGNVNYGLGLSTTLFDGNTKQRVGAITVQIGDFSARLDEDFFPGISDQGDQFRTGGLLMTYKVNEELTVAFGGFMITGSPDKEQDRLSTVGYSSGTYDPDHEKMTKLRAGTMYGGIIYNGQALFGGHNSEKRLHDIQNWIHRNIKSVPSYFYDHNLGAKSYGYSGTYDSNYLIY